jgi:glycosyltransferase involved in cell wall biosynthesis
MKQMEFNVIYILQTSAQYQSDAAYNRVRLFCQGLIENGVGCSIFRIEIPQRKSILSKVTFLIKNTILLFCKFLSLNKRNIVIVYGETYFSFLYKLLASKASLVFERTEYPAYIINPYLSNRSKRNSINNFNVMKLSNRLITCSYNLAHFYSVKTPESIVFPLIIDNSEFGLKQNRGKEDVISYCGSFDNNKDGIPILLKAFFLFHSKFPSYKLVLMGTGSRKELERIQGTIQELQLIDSVILTGRVSHDVVIDTLCNSSMLVLARPSNKQAEGGIPSKVGEYISTGVPCVITNVGELSDFMKDGLNCYMSEPDSPEKFCEKMIECVSNNNESIVDNALLLSQSFNYKEVSKVLLDFLSVCIGAEKK